jgi:hypothetical protein
MCGEKPKAGTSQRVATRKRHIESSLRRLKLKACDE